MTGAICAVAALLLVLGAGQFFLRHPGGAWVRKQEEATPPGELARVVYSRTSSMLAGENFFIALSPRAILETSHDAALASKDAQDGDRFFARENVPITPRQWAEVEEIVLELYPLMKPAPERRPNPLETWIGRALSSWLYIRDGVDENSLYLTWASEDGAWRVRYSMPNDRRIHTLVALLEELADPIGREIPRYDPPELEGFYIGQNGSLFSKEYSFQFRRGPSAVSGEDAPYILIAYFYPSGQSQMVRREWTVPDAEWDAFAAFAQEKGLEAQRDGRSKKMDCTLYYSDGKQQGKKLDRETANAIREYLTGLAQRLQQEQPYP